MLEKHVEAYLVRRCKERGWLCEKFTSPSRRSVPDRLLSLPGGRVIFVELKAPGKTVTEAQARDHERRRKFGLSVVVLETLASVDLFIESISR